MNQIKKYIFILIYLLSWNFHACTGAGPAPSPLAQNPNNNTTNSGSAEADRNPQAPSDRSTNSEEKNSPDTSNTGEGAGAIAFMNPPAQPTQPLTPHLGLYVKGIVILSGTDPQTTCERNFENIPTVKVWEREKEGGSWKLNHILAKYDPNVDASNPYPVHPCGNFIASLPLLLGPANNPCLWNNEAKLTASYKDSNGVLYTGESHLYTCQDAGKLPLALIVLENKMINQVMMPNYLNP